MRRGRKALMCMQSIQAHHDSEVSVCRLVEYTFLLAGDLLDGTHEDIRHDSDAHEAPLHTTSDWVSCACYEITPAPPQKSEYP